MRGKMIQRTTTYLQNKLLLQINYDVTKIFIICEYYLVPSLILLYSNIFIAT